MIVNPGEIKIRRAIPEDIEFLATTIIESEKSSTNNIGTANLFGINEEEYRTYLVAMLDEGIDGCELSISSFLVAEYEGEVIAATAGWVEGRNEDHLPSAILKSNLYSFIIPRDVLSRSISFIPMVKDLQIYREENTYQFEFSYTKPEFRGNHIIQILKEEHIKIAIALHCPKVQTHVFETNTRSIIANQRCGLEIIEQFVAENDFVKQNYPCATILLMEKKLN